MKIIRNDLKKITLQLEQWLEDAAEIVGTEAVNEVHTHFEEQGVDGQPWKPRVPGTPRNSRKLLSDTNTLEDSIRYEVQMGGKQVAVGLDENLVPYAEIQQEGGTIEVTDKMKRFFWAKYLETGDVFYKRLALAKGPFKVPARPYLVITERMVRRIEAALIAYLKQIQ